MRAIERERSLTRVLGRRCNITLEVNHLTEGIRLGLQDDREKNSDALGRLALFKVLLFVTLSACQYLNTVLYLACSDCWEGLALQPYRELII